MLQNIKEYLSIKGIDGNIILYRDKQHKKKALCEYLAEHIVTDKTITCRSSGAFGLYMAKAFSNNTVEVCGPMTQEYKQQAEKLSNVILITGVHETSPESTNVKNHAVENDLYYVNQYGEPLIEEYYKNHFTDIIMELGDINIDAFCDCGHSCATLSGAIDNELASKWTFILGVNLDNRCREHAHYLNVKKDKFIQETTRNFDTKQIQVDLENMYPAFGNIFEATRSISAAMSWLQKNPGKTVLVYVGDSPVFGEDAEI